MNPPDHLRILTDREVEVLKLVAEGKTNLQVAQELWLTEHTVKTHLRRISYRLRCKSSDRTLIIVTALKSGQLKLEDINDATYEES